MCGDFERQKKNGEWVLHHCDDEFGEMIPISHLRPEKFRLVSDPNTYNVYICEKTKWLKQHLIWAESVIPEVVKGTKTIHISLSGNFLSYHLLKFIRRLRKHFKIPKDRYFAMFDHDTMGIKSINQIERKPE